jgi:hypothetical protein
MLWRLGLLLGLLAAAFVAPRSAHAERRVALVVGNSAYVNATALRNPRNDAADIAETLKKLGFEVDIGLDLDQRGFAQTIEKFGRDLEGADVGLFFYAGHALQINEKNYLVSTAAKLENEFLITSETMELEPIIRLMESKASINLIFLDACRNNPLADNLRRSLAATKRSGSLGRGLARIESTGRDTLVAFAAAPGQEAADGSDRNSPFTSALLKHLPQPGLEVSVMLKEVAADVRRDTRNSQRPQQLSDMTRTFYFAQADTAASTKTVVAKQETPSAPPSNTDRSLDVAYWNSAQSANDCESVRTYLQRFPDGAFVDLAKLAERRLCTPGRRVTVEPDPAPLTPAPPAVTLAPAPAVAEPPPPAAIAPPPASSNTLSVTDNPVPTTDTAQPNIAALPEIARLSTETDSRTLTRNIQLELVRLGCYSGRTEGEWEKPTKDAITKFNRYAHARLGTDEPSDDLISALRGHDERVCPLICARGFRAQGDNCVTIERAPSAKERRTRERLERRQSASRRPPEPAARIERAPSAKERRPRERSERRESVARRPAEVASPRGSAAKPASTPMAEFHNPLCTSRIQMPGGKWCCSYDPPRGATVIICR